MSYRDDLDALTARHAALDTEVAVKSRERDVARGLLDDAKARARLPVLDNIRVASPCTADWNQMTGDDRARACGACNKTVYNLSEMTRDEAEALIREREGRLCARYFQRLDGTIILADCSIGAQRKRRRRWIAAGAAALLAGGGAVGYEQTRRVEVTMGAMDLPITENAAVSDQAVAQVKPDVQIRAVQMQGDVSFDR